MHGRAIPSGLRQPHHETGHHIKNYFGRRVTFRNDRDQAAYLLGMEILQQSHSDQEDSLAWVNRLHPAQVERRTGKIAVAVAIGQK